MEVFYLTNDASAFGNPYVQGGMLVVVIVGVFLWRVSHADSYYSGFDVAGTPRTAFSVRAAKEEYVKNAKGVLLGRVRKLKNAFQVMSDIGPKIVLPHNYANQVKNLKELSVGLFVQREFFTNYPGFEATKITTETRVVQDTIRDKLSKALNPLTAALCEEADMAFHGLYGDDSKEWTQFTINKHANDLIARLTTRVFFGDTLCRNKRWLRIAVDFTHVFVDASRVLRLWPAIARPIVHWFLPQCVALRKLRNDAQEIILAEIKRRNKLRAEGKMDSKSADTLGWMQEMSKGKSLDIVGGQLALTLAAVHTTSDLIAKVVYHFCAYPEEKAKLRKEIIDVLNERGWSKAALFHMKLLDSFIKEVQRHTPFSLTTMNRVAADEVTLSDGTIIPKGAAVTVLIDSFSDPNIYSEPDKFDSHRYLTLRSQPGQENNWQLATPSPEHMGFGYGAHACPGRFLAANEIKVAIIFMLLRYEWRQDSPKDTPLIFSYGTENMANPQMQVSYKRRQEEIDVVQVLEESGATR